MAVKLSMDRLLLGRVPLIVRWNESDYDGRVIVGTRENSSLHCSSRTNVHITIQQNNIKKEFCTSSSAVSRFGSLCRSVDFLARGRERGAYRYQGLSLVAYPTTYFNEYIATQDRRMQ
jgi:hypothetical protein